MSRARSDVYRLQPSFPRKRESSGLVPGFITEATLTFAPLASARTLLRPLLALLRCVNLMRRCQVLVGERRQRRRHAGEGGCNPITKSGSLILISVVPAKAGTQGFRSPAPGSPLSRGRRVELSARFSDSLVRWCDEADGYVLRH